MNAKIKVLLASRPKLLSEVIRYLVARQPDMEVVSEVLDPIELLFAARATSVDVVIVTPLDSDGETKLCRHLLAEHPHLIIVALSAQGEAAFLYGSRSPKKRVDEPSEQSILGAVRAAMKPISE